MRLHEILYASAGSKSTRKKHVLEWATKASSLTCRQIEAIRKSISETEILTILKEICVMLDVNVPVGRPAIESAILDVLVQPDTPKEEKSQPESLLATPEEQDAKKESEQSSDSSEETVETKPTRTVVRVIRTKKGGRKKGSKNKTPEQREAERVERLTKPRGRPGRKKGSKNSTTSSPSIDGKRRGRPLKFSETRAFRAFVQQQHPEVYQQWLKMPQTEQEEYWVRHK
jgi:hypothetical protein